MSIKSVLQSTFSHLYPRASDADDELLLSLAGPAAAAPTLAAGGEAAEPGAEEPGAEESVAEPEPEPDAYDIEIQHIESRLQSQLAHSRRLTEHLLTEARRAREIDASVLQAAEFAHGTVFKKLGLPVHVSNFKVDPVLAKNTGLLHAHELLREVQQTRAEAMCEPDDMDLAARESSVRPLPHYLDPTANQRVRSETSKAKRAALVSSVRGMRELRQTRELFDGTADGASLSQVDPASLAATGQAEATATLIVAERARKPAAGTMSIMQRELEEDVMRRMQAPLNFLRNPRYQRKQFMSAAEAPILPPKHVHTGMSFHCQPQVVLFTDYQIGGCYEIPLELHNVGPLSRRLRILPPASAYFSISLVQYPGDDGFVAPGLHARVLIRFAPDSLGDYDGFILVQTETDSFGVPLKTDSFGVLLKPPSLSLQDVFDAGWCFVGGSKHVSAAGTNEGGDGKFAIVARSDWDADDGIAKRVARETECVANDFVIAPRLLDVPAGASYDLGLTYAPTTVGEHAAEVLLVCDNCHVRPVRVVGQACVVDMLLESVDGSAPPFFSPQTPLSFPETTVGGSRISVVRYSNRTPLPIKFRMAGDSVLVWDSADCEPPMEHGDGAAGMPFSIEPSSGALPAGTVAEFTVTFAPQLRALHGCYAHLAISGVPDEALPGYGRAKGALAALTDAEHSRTQR
ncbi:hypothetical protein T492DRAFT_838132 [Pavlovales sp. CCMP2436]|nr:hypothetical protein T492DRAFT_838132 [Pavlovales sp. CCMP2436]